MGTLYGPYDTDFPPGACVRIAPLETLSTFRRPHWKFHHPIEESQLAFADQEAIGLRVSVYHGGDELYELEGLPGIWHEKCLLSSK